MDNRSSLLCVCVGVSVKIPSPSFHFTLASSLRSCKTAFAFSLIIIMQWLLVCSLGSFKTETFPPSFSYLLYVDITDTPFLTGSFFHVSILKQHAVQLRKGPLITGQIPSRFQQQLPAFSHLLSL